MANKYMMHVKIYYCNGKYRYANLFKTSCYEYGIKCGSIIGYRKMNCIEKFIFRNCM